MAAAGLSPSAAHVILYENAPEPAVRAGEFDLGGRRVAARALPYGTTIGVERWSFDPIERLFLLRATGGSILVGPHDPDAWRKALARGPAGNVAVSGCDPSEEIRGSYRAAAEGAAKAGRGVFLLDPSPSALPDEPSPAYVTLFVALPGRAPSEGLGESLRRGFCAGLIVPLVPGWTCDAAALKELSHLAEESGARFVAALPAAQDGPARRAAIEVREELSPEPPEDFFERVHHGNWRAETEEARLRLREVCASGGLPCEIPRPVGLLEPPANAAAAKRLEEKADEIFALDEHRASLFHAAARWIDESGRDLAPIVAEGNFRKIFPFVEEIACEAEAALRDGR